MSSIADKLAAAKQAAVASSGVPGATAAAAPSAPKAPDAAQKAAVQPVVSKSSVSALKPSELIPRKTKEGQVLFKTVKPNLNCIISGPGREPKKIHFVNQYLLTDDTEVIEYVRKNAKAFAVSEIESTANKKEAK